ncbi:MAG: SGNH/GDSL hydrolase family protein [Planctomycetes bacterium]|nr:SGNH/GDSL hydrolase family protein [Planctomycetota bacterium]
MTVTDEERALLQARRWALALGSLCLALSVALGLLLEERSRRPPPRPVEVDDAARQAAIDAMVAATEGIMDHHTDPDVGHVLLPGLDGASFLGVPVVTDADGMREQPIARPKPAGVLRVALLGDSFLFGWRVPVEERLDRVLEDRLREALPGREVEVLALAVPSWNLRAESAWYRRQAALLQADVVFVHVCDNDLDDTADVRGFGRLATTSSQYRDRADALVWRGLPVVTLGSPEGNPLLLGLDALSLGRWADAVDDVRALVDAVAGSGGRTALLLNVNRSSSLAREHLVEPLGDVPAVWIPARFAGDGEFRMSELDPHWNPAGQRRVAELLYAALGNLDLLPGVDLPPWEPASSAWRTLHEFGEYQAERDVDPEDLLAYVEFVSEIVPHAGGFWSGAFQVYAGVDADGRLGPYVAFVLPVDDETGLVLELAGMGRADLPRVTLAVEVDGKALGAIDLRADETVRRRFQLPAGSSTRRLSVVRIVADDWIYAEDDLRHCVSSRLVRAALE